MLLSRLSHPGSRIIRDWRCLSPALVARADKRPDAFQHRVARGRSALTAHVADWPRRKRAKQIVQCLSGMPASIAPPAPPSAVVEAELGRRSSYGEPASPTSGYISPCRQQSNCLAARLSDDATNDGLTTEGESAMRAEKLFALVAASLFLTGAAVAQDKPADIK